MPEVDGGVTAGWTLPQRVLLDMGRLLFGSLFRLRTEGLHHLPRTGGALVVCSHTTLLEPILVTLALPRAAAHIAEVAPWKYPAMGYLMDLLDTIPLERGIKAVRALRAAIRHIQAGGVVVMFPEGKISPTGELLTFQPGAARVALDAGCPVIPAALCGSYEAMPAGRMLPRFSPTTFRMGPPMDLSPARRAGKPDLDQVAAAMRWEVARLHTPWDPRTR